jgi:hypothetical protein
VVVVVDIQSLTRNMVVAEVVWAAAAVDSRVVEAGTIRLVEEATTVVVTRQVEEVTTVVTRQVEEVTWVVTPQVEEVTTVVTLQVEEVFLLVEVATVVPVEAAVAVVTGVAVPTARLRVPVPAPVLDGEYGVGDQLSGC